MKVLYTTKEGGYYVAAKVDDSSSLTCIASDLKMLFKVNKVIIETEAGLRWDDIRNDSKNPVFESQLSHENFNLLWAAAWNKQKEEREKNHE